MCLALNNVVVLTFLSVLFSFGFIQTKSPGVGPVADDNLMRVETVIESQCRSTEMDILDLHIEGIKLATQTGQEFLQVTEAILYQRVVSELVKTFYIA